MMFSAFFWDFDGTLFDTYPRIVRAFLRGLDEYGIRADGRDALRRMKATLGAAAAYYAETSGIEGLTGDMIVEAYRRHSEEEDPSGIRLYPGAEEALRRAVEKGGANYLYTHRGPTAWPAIERAGLTELFSGGVTAMDGFPAKPDPGALNHLIEKYHLPRNACAMVGDRMIDLDAAANAGIEGVLFDPDGLCGTSVKYRFTSMRALSDALM